MCLAYKNEPHPNVNYHIDITPGVSALTTAIPIFELPSDRFLFAGVLLKTIEGKKNIFAELVSTKATLIFLKLLAE